MKTVYTERSARPGTVSLATMKFSSGPTVILDFGDGKLKLGKAFICDAIEHYLEFAIDLGLKEYKKCPSKKAQVKKQYQRTSRK